MDLRAQKRRSFLSQPYGASSSSLTRSATLKEPPKVEHDDTAQADPPPADLTVKLVVVGDGECGKTSLLTRFTSGEFPEDYVPTIFDNTVRRVRFAGKEIELWLWDTAGQEDYDRLRALSYPNTNVFLVCFAVDNPVSLENLVDRWIPEITVYGKGLPFLVVGLKKDKRTSQNLTDSAETRQLSLRLGAAGYVECSARDGVNIEQVFAEALAATVSSMESSQIKAPEQDSTAVPQTIDSEQSPQKPVKPSRERTSKPYRKQMSNVRQSNQAPLSTRSKSRRRRGHFCIII